ncbi:uncharacterized protein LOC144433986 [Glandiceps talaboti]
MSYFVNLLQSLLVLVISEVSAEYCSDYGHSCSPPEYCCSYTCCKAYTHYSFWSMWYFWCIIVFVLMACFGGCGYYRRRHLLVRGRGQPTTVVFASTHPAQTVSSQNTQNVQMPHVIERPVGDFPAPPPYSEVTSKPDMYPKTDSMASPYPPSYPPAGYYPPPQPPHFGQQPQLPTYEATISQPATAVSSNTTAPHSDTGNNTIGVS